VSRRTRSRMKRGLAVERIRLKNLSEFRRIHFRVRMTRIQSKRIQKVAE
jgi:hypothetical protein